ncbi:hypothetical protein NQ317_018638 [Molorchus minor]|uniref:TGF-beta family profile domain-containing protein n=1 Tax=Molorchus minor TaxID=1323400 RepID=A0ABQ9JHD6_9CUCU|nr:hypothetical protein NQ317_018638 [Molorchus minor]
MMGLSKRPNRIKDPLKFPAARYLLDIYKSLEVHESEENMRVKRNIDIKNEEKEKIEQSNTIMTLDIINVSSVEDVIGKVFTFNAVETSAVEDVITAELKLYKSAKDESDYTIRIFEIVKDKESKKLKSVCINTITGGYEGWISLNITGLFRSWIRNHQVNHTIFITVSSTLNPNVEVSLEDIGVIYKIKDNNSPFVVAYLKADNKVTVDNPVEAKSRRKKSLDSVIDYYKSDDDKSKKGCRLQMLYVSFRDLKWQDWILAPEGYQAYYCSGRCNFPLNSHLNATNHAIIQSLVHIMNPRRFPEPCCAPTALISVSVLYFLDDFNVILKKYDKMSVAGCGCH